MLPSAQRESHAANRSVNRNRSRDFRLRWAAGCDWLPAKRVGVVLQKQVKIPGPDHPVSITPHVNRVRVKFGGAVVAETARALAMRERGYAVVFYIPREDADQSLLIRSAHSTYCPYKGDASYFSIRVGDRISENAIWTYETPYDAVSSIKERLAFYPNRVDVIEEV
jgi:uncharacterized protein (DUF427 family)